MVKDRKSKNSKLTKKAYNQDLILNYFTYEKENFCNWCSL